jgi:hypothetical protein
MLIMSWLAKFPWLSLSLVMLTYGTFGWYIANADSSWGHWLFEQGEAWGWALEEGYFYIGIHLMAILSIAMISLALTAPVTLMTIFLGSWLRSDLKSIISILLWSFAFVLMLRWFGYFVRFMILFSAAILGRLELQRAGYNGWQIFTVLTSLCILGFGLGVFGYLWHHSLYPVAIR